jgi:hypothetical protein
MSSYLKYSALFKTGKVFEQILFLDDFYATDAIELSETELSAVLFSGAQNSENLFVKRSCFKIICDLTLTGILNNRFNAAGRLLDFLKCGQDELTAIALKYFPYFSELHNLETEVLLKTLSDDPNAEISSQSYLCLGLKSISENSKEGNVHQLIENLGKAERYFQAAFIAAENRDDADYYIKLAQWISAVLSDDSPEALTAIEALGKSLMLRNLYERDGLELDFLIFIMIEKIQKSYDILRKSGEWIDFTASLQVLMAVNSELEMFRTVRADSRSLLRSIDHSLLNKLENHIFKAHLEGEKKRFNVLKSSDEPDFVKFIEKILIFFPDSNEPNPENYELLISLQKYFAADGVEAYQKIRNKNITLEKAVAELLKKINKNELPIKTGSIQGHEVLLALASQIDIFLPDYDSEKRTAFLNILEEVIRYARVTLVGNEKSRFSFLFNSKAVKNGKGQDAVEQDLQDSMLSFFENSKIADGLDYERSKFVDGGRVDILYQKDIITIPIELKKSVVRPSEAALEEKYLAQAQTYTSGYDQLGIFVLLELSDKTKEAPANFKDWFKIHHLPPSTNMTVNYPDFIISVVIPGNRTGPSSKSIYK